MVYEIRTFSVCCDNPFCYEIVELKITENPENPKFIFNHMDILSCYPTMIHNKTFSDLGWKTKNGKIYCPKCSKGKK